MLAGFYQVYDQQDGELLMTFEKQMTMHIVNAQLVEIQLQENKGEGGRRQEPAVNEAKQKGRGAGKTRRQGRKTLQSTIGHEQSQRSRGVSSTCGPLAHPLNVLALESAERAAARSMQKWAARF